jgi:hypothetical protein
MRRASRYIVTGEAKPLLRCSESHGLGRDSAAELRVLWDLEARL